MLIARRVYIYLVSFISLMMLLAGLTNLLQLVYQDVLFPVGERANTGNYLRDQFSLWGAITLVGGVVWGIHWWLAQSSVVPSRPNAEAERRAVLRRLMIYAVLLVAACFVFFGLAQLIQDIFMLPNSRYWDYERPPLASLLVYSLGWWYYWRVRNQDTAIAPEQDKPATVRRWYFFLANYGSLSAMLYGLSSLVRESWHSFVEGGQVITSPLGWFNLEQANGTGWLVAGLGLWLWHWWQVQRLVASSQEEQRAVLRKVYLYAVILQTVIVTLTSSAFFIYNLLRLAIGTSLYANEPILNAGDAFYNALIYGVFWAYHAQVLHSDAGLLPKELPLQAGIRRFYSYLVALLGLAVLAAGLTSMLRVLLDFWLGGAATTGLSLRSWGDQISYFATLIVIGSPVWYLSWRNLQRQVAGPESGAELHALSRRIYLYLIAFASVITLLSAVSWLIYQIFGHLGNEWGKDLLSQTSWALGATLTAGIALAYHIRVLLSDQHNLAALPAPPRAAPTETGPALPTVLVLVHPTAKDTLEVACQSLRNQLGPTAEIFPAPDLSEEELRDWLKQRKLNQARLAKAEESMVR